VAGDERLRLFLALRLPGDVVAALTAWQAQELGSTDLVRAVPADNLHVTLAFLGARPAGELPAILDVLARAAGAAVPAPLGVDGYRETRSVGMLTLRDETRAATGLAERLHEDLAALGVYRPERRPWLPLPRTAAAPAGSAGRRVGVVRRGCFPFTSAPDRGAVWGARVVSARRLIG
jgi:2'-5' RNA ligase